MTRETATNVAAALLAAVLLQAVLAMPSHPADLTPERFVRPSWELPALLAVLAVFRGRAVRTFVVGLALALVVLRCADLGSRMAFERAFNPLLDLHLLVSGWDLLSGSVGHGTALAMVAGVLGVLALLGLVLWQCLGRAVGLSPALRGGMAGLALAAVLVASAVPRWQPLTVTLEVAEQVDRMGDGIAELADFTHALRAAPDAAPRFEALAGRDVIIAFVESYGRSFIDDPRYAATSAPRLAEVEARLGRAGWGVRSGWLAAPTRGGQSWLSHATLLSGLLVDRQIRYDRLMASRHPSLNGLFRAAGWRTGAAMPAIASDWPEAAWYGYDVMLDAAGLGYAGRPFEWVTMPDQYTWTALDRELRGGGPAMIEVALISSHAPWTPLPHVLPWADIGDGAVFDGTRRTGGTPKEVWSDRDAIRRQYALSLDYALDVLGQYVATRGAGALFVVLGDHQPAPLLTGEGASPDVPVHVISDRPDLLSRLPAATFGPGLIPDPGRATLPMQDFRTILTSVFETPLQEEPS